MSYDPNYEDYTNYYTTELMHIITREFRSPDEDMRKTILRIIMGLPLSRKLIPDYENQLSGRLSMHFGIVELLLIQSKSQG